MLDTAQCTRELIYIRENVYSLQCGLKSSEVINLTKLFLCYAAFLFYVKAENNYNIEILISIKVTCCQVTLRDESNLI